MLMSLVVSLAGDSDCLRFSEWRFLLLATTGLFIGLNGIGELGNTKSVRPPLDPDFDFGTVAWLSPSET